MLQENCQQRQLKNTARSWNSRIPSEGIVVIVKAVQMLILHTLNRLFQAPEHLSRKIVSEKCDVYSFGITLWQLVSKEEVIYKDMHPQTIIYKVKKLMDCYCLC